MWMNYKRIAKWESDLVIDGIAEGHTEADSAAATGGGEDPNAFDVVIHLLEQLIHLALRHRGQGQVGVSQGIQIHPALSSIKIAKSIGETC